jgi:C_GCAxxG_C_C family probable redox protein
MSVDLETETLVDLMRAKAENLYEARRFCCSESILLVVNNSFNGGLSEEAALGLADGFCGGMGGAGCVCGALSSSIMALSLILSPHRRDGLNKNDFKYICKKMHDRFQDRFGSTCCRVLVADFTDGRRGQRQFCGKLTGEAAVLVGKLLFEAKPALRETVDVEYLRSLDTKLAGLMKNLF